MLYQQKYLPSFVRRNRLRSDIKKSLIKENLETFAFPSEAKEIKVFFNSLKYSIIKLEIGFGDGMHLIKRAILKPEVLFIGCEVYLNGIANVLKAIKQSNIRNIMLFYGDARELIVKIPDNILSDIYILFPDPWPKRKQQKRRLISLEFLNLLRNKLVTDTKASIRIVTDHAGYANYINQIIETNNLKNNQDKPQDWITTKYQLKGMAAGYDFKYFTIYK